MERKLDVPSIKGGLRDLIARYLELQYVSESSKDGIRTENRYQSVQLGDFEAPGIRSVRGAILDQIEFSGKRVLDLGSNLGELSRGAAARGAALVDGFEQDSFFVELARAIDAYAEVSRVSHFERDITDPSSYSERYDVVLAFSVFVYVEPVLERLASVTDALFVLETHRLEDNLESYYVRSVGRYFPHYAILGESDWDLRLGAEGDRRAVIAFARDEPTLLESLRAADGSPPNVLRAAVAHRRDRPAPVRRIDLDLTKPPREALQARFFMMFRFDTPEELLAAIDAMEVEVETLARSIEIRNLLAEGWIYWFLFTKGYLQYAKTGEIGEGNVYFDYLVRHFIEQGHDPGALAQLREHDSAVERIARRFRDFDELRAQGAKGALPEPDTKPVRITVNDLPREPPLQLYEAGSERPLPVRGIDGWHRLCSARLSGLERYPCEVIPENLHARPIRGEVERFEAKGGRLRIEGWCINPEEVAYNVEVRQGRAIVATGPLHERPDIAEAFPQIPHARLSGFALDAAWWPLDAEPARFDLIALQEIAPVGLIALLHAEGVDTEAATALYEILRPVVRRRSLESLQSVVEVPGGVAPLRTALERLLPGATVGGFDGASSADLVIAHGADSDLERLASLLDGEGLLAVTMEGELARPFAREAEAIPARDEALSRFGTLFDVVDYVVGGVGARYDLVVLKSRSE